jgi:hypothetical protein
VVSSSGNLFLIFQVEDNNCAAAYILGSSWHTDNQYIHAAARKMMAANSICVQLTLILISSASEELAAV